MCGIAGIVSLGAPLTESDEEFTEMVKLLSHRGPDALGVRRIAPKVLFGHTRLAVIDLQAESNQPMVSADGELAITFNGEIYNYLELRDELVQRGHSFRTQSDTEVLLYAYREWGLDMFERLNGMWAFALFDRSKDRVLLARDRFGVKPLLYAEHDSRISFASEAKCLLHRSPSLRTPDHEVLGAFLAGGNEAIGDRTFYRGIRQLRPGSALLIEGGRCDVRMYWREPSEEPLELSYDDARERFHELLSDAVRIRLRSDVPIALTLSSGYDSAIIAALARRHHQGALRAYTAVFDGHAFNEAPIASRRAEALGIDFVPIHTSVDSVLDTVKGVVSHLDRPTRCAATVPLWHIMKEVRRDVVVVLEGQGADELMGGYVDVVLPRATREAFSERSLQEGVGLFRLMARELGLKRLSKSVLMEFAPGTEKIGRWLRGDARVVQGVFRGSGLMRQPVPPRFRSLLRNQHRTVLVDLLSYGDAVSMAHAIESRLPFMDYRLVSFCQRLPRRYLIDERGGKRILRDTLAQIYPTMELPPRKIGFQTPVNEWFRGAQGAALSSELLDGWCVQHDVFDRHALAALLDRHRAGKIQAGPMLFRFLTTELWARDRLKAPTHEAAASSHAYAA